jgi:hypothetical protein
MDETEIKGSTKKFRTWLRDNKFSYDEQIFRKQLEEIFATEETEA